MQLRNKGKFGPVVPISVLGDKAIILPAASTTVRERKSKKGDKKPVRHRKKKVAEVPSEE